MLYTIKIALRYLKQQKLHTILTIISILLAVTLVCLIGIFSTSLLKSNARYAENQNGSYDALVITENEQQRQALKNCNILKNAAQEKGVYLRPIDENTISNAYIIGYPDGNEVIEKYFNAVIYDENLISMLSEPYSLCLTAGRFPLNDGEITISNIEKNNAKVGDKITITNAEISLKSEYKDTLSLSNLSDEDFTDKFNDYFTKDKVISKTFTIVGITESQLWMTENDAKSLFSENAIDSSYVYIQFKDKYTEEDLEKYLIENTDISIDHNIIYNEELMSANFRGVFGKAKFALCFFAFFLVILFVLSCARLVIDHSFEIITNERISQFGTLASIGASKRQIKGILFIQAAFMSLIAVPLGVIFSLLGSYWFMKIVSGFGFSNILNITSNYDINTFFDSITLYINIPVFLLCIFLSSYGVFVSAFTSAKKALKLAPIEAMRSGANYKKDKKHKKRNKPPKKGILGRIFGFTGLLASRSIHRNNKRFVSTIFSIALSVSLVLTFSSIMQIIKDAKNYQEENCNDYDISFYTKNELPLEEIITKLYSYGTLEDTFGYRDSALGKLSQSETKKLSDELFKHSAGKTFDGIILVKGFDKTSYEKYIEPLSNVSYDDLNKTNGVLLPKSARFVTENAIGVPESVTEFKAWNIKAGDTLSMEPDSLFLKFYKNAPTTLNVSGFYDINTKLTKDYAQMLGTSYSYMDNFGYINIFTTIENMEKWLADPIIETDDDSVHYMHNSYYIQANAKDDLNKARESLRSLSEDYSDYGIMISDNALDTELLRAIIRLFNFVGYTFIIIIAGISILNVMNTIITGILSRRRELAMLRACGMTKGKIYRLIIGECLMYDVLGFAIGSTITILICYGFTQLMQTGAFLLKLYPSHFIISAIALIAITLLIAFISLYRTIKGSIVENIKGIE